MSQEKIADENEKLSERQKENEGCVATDVERRVSKEGAGDSMITAKTSCEMRMRKAWLI